jgi:hypothetical protein
VGPFATRTISIGSIFDPTFWGSKSRVDFGPSFSTGSDLDPVAFRENGVENGSDFCGPLMRVRPRPAQYPWQAVGAALVRWARRGLVTGGPENRTGERSWGAFHETWKRNRDVKRSFRRLAPR